MGLFSKRPPCAICGGKVKGLFTWKVEGQMVCDDCHDRCDLPNDTINQMTMDEFRAYLAFRDENDQLKTQFQINQTVDFGAFEDKIVFDTVNGMFCMHSELKTTIFEGKDIKSFVIREDGAPLFEGSAAGLTCYTSTVPERVNAMAPVIMQVKVMKEMERRARRDGNDDYIPSYCDDLAEPFEKFVVEIQCEHPYWKTITADKDGPTFNDDNPSAQRYLTAYQEGVEIMRQMARALMAVAFPGAPELRAGAGAVPTAPAAPAASADVVAEIQRFKELVDLGVITEEEFAAKKRQLLGI